MFVIYALVDPRDNKEFYVGRTEDLYKRFMQHLRCEGANDAKNARVQELKSLHLLPIMKTLELIQDSAQAAQREAYWIHHFRYLKVALVNDVIYQQEEVAQRVERPVKRYASSKVKPVLKEKLKKNVYSVDEAAKLARCNVAQVWKALENGDLVMSKSGNGILKSSLEKFIVERKKEQAKVTA